MERFLSPYVYVGHNCNNNCIFCSEADSEINTPIPAEQVKSDLEKIRGTYDFVNFMGREPTLRRDLPELVEYAKSLGFSHISIASNGRIYTYEDYVKRLIKSGVTQFGVSFYSSIPEHYDEQAGIKGAYIQAVQGIKNLIKNRSGFESLLVNIPLNNKNVDDLEDTVIFLLSIGVKEINILFIEPLSERSRTREIVGKMSKLGNKAAEIAVKYGDRAKFWLNEFLPCALRPEYRNLFFNCLEKNINKIRIPLCDKCDYKDRCDGVLSYYIDLYGDEEFNLDD